MLAPVRLLVLLILLLLGAFAQGAPVQPAPATAAAAAAQLSVGARTIFVFRSSLAGFPAQDRAEGARKRLDKAIALGGPQRTATHPIAEGTQVLLDGRLLFLVTPGDVNMLAGDTTEEAAQEAAQVLDKVLQERREQGSPRYLLVAGAWCLAATLAYWLVLRGLGLLHRRVRAYTKRAVGRRIEQVRFRNVALLDAEHVVRFIRQASSVLVWSARLFATFLWATFLLGHIPYFHDWGEQLRGYLAATAFDVAGGIGRALPGLVVVVVIAALARLAILTAGSVLKRVERGELEVGWLDQDTAPPTRRLVNVAIVLFALAMAYPYLPGSHTAAFQGVTVLAGLMVSIGGSSLVAQGASGLILMYTRALRKGEYVRIGEAEGVVVELGMFETRLRTGLGAEVSLPNALVLSNTTKNFSRAGGDTAFTLEAAVAIGYDTPWRQVHAMLQQAARETEGILPEPAPFVLQTALSDFYIEYRLVAQGGAASPREHVELRSRLHGRIVDVFNLNGVQMTSPHFMQEPATSHVVAPQRWEPAPAAAQAAAPGARAR
ncbi:mechanosensitive ion channel family protein [Telluria sp. B2]